ncbi:MAG TPA: hypothetical protein VFW16_06345 [Streptosporangiaceae bacterium]|nr:hypothetical protein [Streptosporangiaceae bacterium]
MSVKAAPRHRRDRAHGTDQAGGTRGNERLTAMTGAVLLVLLAAEGVTILFKREMMTLHFFIGMLLVGPVLLKIGSTGYRFVRYYTGSEPYVRKGPPALLLRLLGPVVIATSAGVIGSGVALAVAGPRSPQWIFVHKATFVLWFGAMFVHVLWYVPRLPRLLTTGSAGRERVSAVLAGAGRRWLLLTGALAIGLVLALATYHLAGPWTGQVLHDG